MWILAVKCMQHGAFDYMLKPVEKSRLVGGVKRAVELRELQRENQLLKAHVLSDKLEKPEAFSEIITVSTGMRSIFQYVEAIANSPRPVLITGETGVGKELVAKAVHTLSSREGDFLPVNVAGLDDHVFADTLFGHNKGAFTDAREARNGLIERAAGGTLFLDEIGDLSSTSQVKLLRLLQEGEFFPLGSDVAKRSDARIVVATNQDSPWDLMSPNVPMPGSWWPRIKTLKHCSHRDSFAKICITGYVVIKFTYHPCGTDGRTWRFWLIISWKRRLKF